MALFHTKVVYPRNQIDACDYRDGLDTIDENGCVDVLQGLGLGMTHDWALIERNRTGRVEYK